MLRIDNVEEAPFLQIRGGPRWCETTNDQNLNTIEVENSKASIHQNENLRKLNLAALPHTNRQNIAFPSPQ